MRTFGAGHQSCLPSVQADLGDAPRDDEDVDGREEFQVELEVVDGESRVRVFG